MAREVERMLSGAHAVDVNRLGTIRRDIDWIRLWHRASNHDKGHANSVPFAVIWGRKSVRGLRRWHGVT